MSLRFETGVEFITGYRLMERLGSGGFGEVWKCEAPGGIFKAVKIIHGDLRSQNDDMIRYAEQELKAMKRVKAVRHPYLLAIDRYDIVEGRLLIVMELADCNLWDRFRQCRLNGLTGIGRDELLVWMLEAAEVLDLMNFEHQLLHLDIKPQNMFLQYNHVKVGDFGQVKDLEGIMASVTGGITPVYAAPETFDGIVTRYCDQYSLACVYQELLTGTRPFDGSSMQQLMMQHLTNPPNLTPSPAPDRPALAKALAKKPEDRFANCTEFVNVMRHGLTVNATPSSSLNNETIPWGTVRPPHDLSLVDTQGSTGNSSVVSFATTGVAATPLPEQLTENQPSRIAPPVQTGPGPLRPALVIGVGATGLRIIQQFRKQIADRFGSTVATPAVRTLYIDTDPETLAAAVTDRTWDGLTALKADELFAARLNRATHYMKPRSAGRTLFEGWFDPKWLHLLPRNPLTQGMRPFGRLALCDHYRSLTQKIEADLDTVLTPEALQDTMQATHLELGTNRPRIYLAASLAGGTGSGMILDLAYILRNKLRRLGYPEADVVGLLILPPDDPELETSPIARGNVYAALTELHHYTQPDTVFSAYYDDRHTYLRDMEPPFKDVFLLPSSLGPAQTVTPLTASTPARNSWSASRSSSPKLRDTNRHALSGTTKSGTQRPVLRVLDDSMTTATAIRDTLAAAADWLRLELFGPFGRTLESARLRPAASSHVTVSTFGLVRYEWPRTEVVTRTARVVTGVMLNNWVSPDPGRAREVVPTWTANLWTKLGLDMDGFIDRLRFAADQTVGTCAETLLVQSGETALPKGWLNRTPDAAQVAHVLVKFEQFIGHPVASTSRQPTAIEEATRLAANDLATLAQAELASAVPRLIDDPEYRLAGAEEAARQLLADLTRMSATMNSQADRLDEESLALYESLSSHAHATRLSRTQGPQLSEALRQYPKLRFQSVLARRAARTYSALKELLTTLKNEMANCRHRLLGLNTALLAELETVAPDPAPHQVMPPGCFTVEDAAKRYLEVLTDDDLHQIEVWAQGGIERHYGGLYQACLNTSEGAAGLLHVLRDETRAYLNARLGDVDLTAMFEQKFGSGGLADAFSIAYEQATPELVGAGPWSKSAVELFAAPAGESGEVLRHAAYQVFPEPQAVAFADTPDETVIYREYPDVPLAALSHLGPVWQSAYETASEMTQCSPHARIDVASWKGVDT